ncbi:MULTISPECIES: hypothetical protein [Rhodococcus erythropolis group]|uniref:hypothetical protein n=1 Tax=Rhodococcus erythropolis group TaxID=2840174 RepID=UPI001BE5FC83|nr:MULTISPECIES: hypothetical protein [Rhodococcus erythropolis group]MBT2269668.1 hypothetical protein [Rhodococcus erythropolis]MBT2274185.1 hypothetical protein [Rhodococcus qingshengii]
MTDASEVRQCAAVICAYLCGDEEGRRVLQEDPDFTYRRWYEGAVVVCVSVLELVAADAGRSGVDVICAFVPEVHGVVVGRREPEEALAIVLYYHLHREVIEVDDVAGEVLASLFDIAVTGIEQMARGLGRPPVEVARLLAIAAETYRNPTW